MNFAIRSHSDAHFKKSSLIVILRTLLAVGRATQLTHKKFPKEVACRVELRDYVDPEQISDLGS